MIMAKNGDKKCAGESSTDAQTPERGNQMDSVYHGTGEPSRGEFQPGEQPGYYAIIPATVRYDDTLPANAKLLYGEISALVGKDGYCYATNQYFAGLFTMAEETISRLIARLEKAGHIHRTLIRDETGQIVQRRLYLKVSVPERQPLDEKINTSPQKNQEGIDEKVKETNTSINNIYKRKNKKEKSANELTVEELRPLIVDRVRQLGSQAGWSPEDMNRLYTALVSFYSPRPIKGGKKPPVRSALGLTSLCNKLAREGQGRLDAILGALDDAIAAGWTTAYPKADHRGSAPPAGGGGRRYEEI